MAGGKQKSIGWPWMASSGGGRVIEADVLKSEHVVPSRAGHAVVVGGSIAGLLAARILTDHFAKVTVLDRDQLPDTAAHRRGVPQSRHIHVLLVRGSRELEFLLPGLHEELSAAGAPDLDWLADFRWLNFAGWKPRYRSDLVGCGCSRELLESIIRRLVLAHPRVQLRDGREVMGLIPGDGKRHVRGVKVRGADSAERGEQEVHADLVIDASGRDSRAPEWLSQLEYAPPAETVINSFVGYASRCYQSVPDLNVGWKGLYIQATPPSVRRGGIIYPIEGNRWMVALVGVGRDYPPTDEAGFVEFARSLPDPAIHDIIRRAEPLSPIYGIRRTENRLRHYDRLRRKPEAFLVLGDAACALNPVYGQGMTVAALAARALDESLRRQKQRDGMAGLADDFQNRLARAQKDAWLLATGEDFRVEEVEGGRPGPLAFLLQRYADAVMLTAAGNPGVHRTVVEVLTLVKPPMALFRPGIVVPVLRNRIFRNP